MAAVINARTVEAADAALAGLDGGLKSLVEGMRSDCIHLLARVDAHIDYEDELEPLNYKEIEELSRELNRKVCYTSSYVFIYLTRCQSLEIIKTGSVAFEWFLMIHDFLGAGFHVLAAC